MSFITDGIDVLRDGIRSSVLDVLDDKVKQLAVNLFLFGVVGIALVGLLLFIVA